LSKEKAGQFLPGGTDFQSDNGPYGALVPAGAFVAAGGAGV
jgi:hypothetical protein